MYLVIIITGIINFEEDNQQFISGIETGFEISRIGIEISGNGIETYCEQ